jgi:hypothetical protein
LVVMNVGRTRLQKHKGPGGWSLPGRSTTTTLPS